MRQKVKYYLSKQRLWECLRISLEINIKSMLVEFRKIKKKLYIFEHNQLLADDLLIL